MHPPVRGSGTFDPPDPRPIGVGNLVQEFGLAVNICHPFGKSGVNILCRPSARRTFSSSPRLRILASVSHLRKDRVQARGTSGIGALQLTSCSSESKIHTTIRQGIGRVFSFCRIAVAFGCKPWLTSVRWRLCSVISCFEPLT